MKDKCRKTVLLLSTAVIIGGLFICGGCSPGQEIDIQQPSSDELTGQVYISGGVNIPGIYPLKEGDTLESLIQAAGGLAENATLDTIELYILYDGQAEAPQLVDINRAEAWLLDALPGIGPALAEAIVTYREQNGLFCHCSEINNVDGIGQAIYEQIKDLITVSG